MRVKFAYFLTVFVQSFCIIQYDLDVDFTRHRLCVCEEGDIWCDAFDWAVIITSGSDNTHHTQAVRRFIIR